MSDRMTKGERDDLLRLIRQREKVCKSAAQERSAALLADFEGQISAIYKADDDVIWKAAADAAAKAVAAAQQAIADRCAELGIPEEFAPGINMGWYGRGQSSMRARRDELRRKAKAQIEALEKTARVAIERESVSAQTEVLANGLISDAARAFLAQMPSVDTLMPTLEIKQIEGMVRRTNGLD